MPPAPGSLLVATALFLMTAPLAGCRGTASETVRPVPSGASPCDAPPVGYVRVVPDRELSTRLDLEFRGRLEAIGEPDDLGFLTLRFSADEGERTVRLRVPAGSPGLEPGGLFEVQVEVVEGSPAPCALVMRDAGGLRLAAVSDWSPGAHVLREGLPEMAVSLASGECAPRAAPPCFSSIRNLTLRVEAGGADVTIGQGGTAALGAFDITVFAAQSLSASGDCADAGRHGASYLITRRP